MRKLRPFPRRGRHSRAVLNLGLVGCGAIGRTLASVLKPPRFRFRCSAVFDSNPSAALSLSRSLKTHPKVCTRLDELIRSCDFILEAASQRAAFQVAEASLKARKPVMLLSTGGFFLQADRLSRLAHRQKTKIYLPSGAVAGMDGLKAARQVGRLKKVTITSSKPPRSFAGAPGLTALQKKSLGGLKRPLQLYAGPVEGALKRFPANVNVSATTALAAGGTKIKVRVVADPAALLNRHEIRAEGDFGFLTCTTENHPSRLNPKTSALAVQSALALLERIGAYVEVGA